MTPAIKNEGEAMGVTVEVEAINMPACGLDVHKDTIEAAVITEDGKMHQKTFGTMRNALYALRDWILSLKCFHVLMESTSVFWVPIYEILEDVIGMDVGVGNARDMRNSPGRPKTDKVDARWNARLSMLGIIRKSFVVGRKFRELREYTRYHKKLVQDRTRQSNRIEKLLQLNGFKLSSVLSDIFGVSGRGLLDKLANKGYVTLDEVKATRDPRCKKPAEEIESAINGKMKLTSRILLKKMLERLDACDMEIAEIYGMMVEAAAPYASQIRILDSIPGLAELSAIYIIAEISTDMSSFANSNRIAAWAGLAPKDNKSAGKLKSSKTKKANIYIKSILTECAWAAVKTRNTRVSNWYHRNSKKIGEKKAIIAVARKLLVYIYSMLKSGEMYDVSLDVADTQKRRAYKLESARKILDNVSSASNAEQQAENANPVSETRKIQRDTQKTQQRERASKPDEAEENKNADATPKKRGRPRKAPDDGKSSGDALTPPKKRGRPRKKAVSDDISTGDTSI